MRTRAALLALFVLTACSGQGTVAQVSPTASPGRSPTATASASSSPSTVSNPTPAVSATPQTLPVGVGLNVHCRLPVSWITDPTTDQTSHAGFLSFPSQQLTEDRSAPAKAEFYDRAFGKWLPVSRDLVSPDGSHYAYAKTNSALTGSTVHVVDVASGVDRALFSGNSIYSIVQYADEGIYLTAGYEVTSGLWLENPAGGQPRPINSTVLLPRVSLGAAWGLTADPLDHDPAPGGLMSGHDEILRFDLSTGASIPWWYHPGQDLHVMDGDYSGDLFVQSYREPVSPYTIWAVTSANSAKLVYMDQNSSGMDSEPEEMAAVDANGTWFDSAGANNIPGLSPIWLFSGGGLTLIAVVPQDGLVIAGGCIPA